MPYASLRGLLAVVVLNLFEVDVDDGVLAAAGIRRRACLAAASRALIGLILCLSKLHRGLRQRVDLLLDAILVLALERRFQLGDGVLDQTLVAGRNLVAEVLEHALGRVDEGLALVPHLDKLAALLVFLGVALG